MADAESIVVSNGEDFFEIPASDVAAALSDGFYIPRERGMAIVTNGDDVFEIPVDDVVAALSDGFREVTAGGLPDVADPAEVASEGTESPSESVTEPAAEALAESQRPVDESASDEGKANAAESDSGAGVDGGDIEPEVAADSGGTENVVVEVSNAEPADVEASRVASQDAEHSELVPPKFNVSETTPEAVESLEEVEIEEPEDPEAERRNELREAMESAQGMEKLKLFATLHAPTRAGFNRFMRSYGASTLLHVALLVMLGMWIMKSPDRPELHVISSVLGDSETPAEDEGPPVEMEVSEDVTETTEDVEQLQESLEVTQLEPAELAPEMLEVDFLGAGEPAAKESGGEGTSKAASVSAGAKATRAMAVKKYGGTPSSEAAVEATLDWLARHQASDGSWCFNHAITAGCRCSSPGTNDGRTGATGVALLTYFGAGYTFADGPRAETIRRGLQFLLQSIHVNQAGFGDLKGGDEGNGGIYQHGLAAAALCEALAVNRVLIRMLDSDDELEFVDTTGRKVTRKDLVKLANVLQPAAQLAVNYTVFHQDPKVGGWGYQPKSAGDMSILGWQVMALISARSENLVVPPATWQGINNFLNEASTGGLYSYRIHEKPKHSTTAIGALCRMYTGWTRSNPSLKQAVNYLLAKGPNRGEMYYNYYATQTLFAWGDDEGDDGEKLWTEWNDRTRDMLVATQGTSGHEKGSWPGAKEGGRHFNTCLAAMTLEIYYRKLPVYQRLSLEPVKLK